MKKIFIPFMEPRKACMSCHFKNGFCFAYFYDGLLRRCWVSRFVKFNPPPDIQKFCILANHPVKEDKIKGQELPSSFLADFCYKAVGKQRPPEHKILVFNQEKLWE